MMKVYFDNAATTPIDPEVLDTMIPIMKDQFGNPSSVHSFGRQTRSAIENARKKVAQLLNASPSEIFFTSGGTEADNIAIRCAVFDLGIKHAITSPLEHHAVLQTLVDLEQRGYIKLSMVPIDETGNIILSELEKLLAGNEKSFVSLMHANNEVGNILPLSEVGTICRKYDAIFHSDTVQTVGHYQHDLQNVEVDFIACAAHKFHGPKGVGALYINNKIKIKPLITGGPQERNMRGGTENIYGIVGLAKALEIAHRDMDRDRKKIEDLKQYMVDKLESEIPQALFNGGCVEGGLYTVLNVCLPANSMAEMMIYNLDISGIAVSGGSACSSGSDAGSHVLKALKIDASRPSIRFSFSKFNTKEEVDFTISKLKEMYSLVNA